MLDQYYTREKLYKYLIASVYPIINSDIYEPSIYQSKVDTLLKFKGAKDCKLKYSKIKNYLVSCAKREELFAKEIAQFLELVYCIKSE